MDCGSLYIMRNCDGCSNFDACHERVKEHYRHLTDKELNLVKMLYKVRVEGRRLSNSYFGNDQWIQYNASLRRYEYEDGVAIGTNIHNVIRYYNSEFQSWSKDAEWFFLDEEV